MNAQNKSVQGVQALAASVTPLSTDATLPTIMPVGFDGCPQQSGQQEQNAAGQYLCGTAPPIAAPVVVTPSQRSMLEHMKVAKRWLLHKDKRPYYANGNSRGKTDTAEDVAMLATYEDVGVVFKQNPGRFTGIGFALGPDGNGGYWQGIDIDSVAENRLVNIANALPGYVEMSPSGKGCHAIGYGIDFSTLGSNGTGIEAYDRGRYFTFTGNTIRDAGLTCIARFVETVLVPVHRRNELHKQGASGVTRVDARTVSDLRSALMHMRADDYQLWIDIGLALRELGEVGRGLWMDWSATSEKFKPPVAAKKWESFNPSSTGYQAVFAKAQAQGWINPSSNAAAIANSKQLDTHPDHARELVSRTLNSVQMRAIDWLWTGWIPRGYITLWAGESGAGKSIVLADVTAKVTTGAPWPGEPPTAVREPGRVLWLGSEDGIEELTVPRLTASGANLERVTEIQGVMQRGQRGTFSMQDDIAAVGNGLNHAKSCGAPYTMLVVDPITSYLSGQKLKKVDMNDAGQLRTVLEPWLILAQEHGIAIVCVTHFMKDTTRAMLHRVLGSAAFVQTCRSLCTVVARPDDGPYAKALIQVKGNLPEHPGGAWRFSTVKMTVGIDGRNNKPIDATRADWEELDSALTPESLIGGTRGPVSKFPEVFGLWLRAHFMTAPPDQCLTVESVRAAAVSEGIVTEPWFKKNSGDYLDKQNVGGRWWCRPKMRQCETR